MKPWAERIYNGVVKENPALVLMLGMCPTLAVTTSAINGFGMGMSTMAVLIVSNPGHFSFEKSHSRGSAPAGVYRHRRISGNGRGVSHGGLSSGALWRAGNLYSPDRGKLYYPGTRGGICL